MCGPPRTAGCPHAADATADTGSAYSAAFELQMKTVEHFGGSLLSQI